ncbi:hypothetical protein IQ266_14245 [filamentous cyanobacterium LEGE 11480]|uniref:Uncharacterized protein n=1 Tax=Romeriopsis navalis LEGE 11480 TaxID=2777977 RepID=A0A928VNF5_9CYAN|nr:hypothetical protein [Romeriopsis navalis]MBE9030893.1 hypothetical protein [Romeriopsis navalis LEGE 11480]
MRFRYLFYSLIGILGLYLLFPQTLRSGLLMIPGDAGDGRLNNYFLEHSFQWISNPNYRGSLLSPIFFYPQPTVLPYSENLFGTAPIYWLFRQITEPVKAFTLWMFALSFLNFGAMVFTLRRWQIHPVIASLGGWLFAFSLNRAVRLTHAQLIPQLFTPLALLSLWHFLTRPSKKAFCGLLIFSYWQILSGIYLGWFLFFSMALLSVLTLVLVPQSRKNIYRFCQQSTRLVVVGSGLWLSGLVLLLYPYVQVGQVFGKRSYAEVTSMLPRLASWFVTPAQGTIWSAISAPFSQGLPALHEHQIFLGGVTYILSAWTLYIVLRPPNWITPDRYQAIRVFFGAAVLMFLISLIWPNGSSAWVGVYRFVPGASAMRVVTRIASLIQVNLLIANLLVLDSFFKAQRYRRLAQALLLSGLLSIAIFEQHTTLAYVYHQDEILPQEQALEQVLQQRCQVAYYALPTVLKQASTGGDLVFPKYSAPYPVSYTGHLSPRLIWILAQVSVMWSSLNANVPIINGYSGHIPPTFPRTEANWSVAHTLTWLEQQEQQQAQTPTTAFCYITDRVNPTQNTAPVGNWQLQSQQSTALYNIQIWQKSRQSITGSTGR